MKLTNSKQRPRHLKAFTPIHVTYLRDNGFLDGKSSRERTDLSEPVSGRVDTSNDNGQLTDHETRVRDSSI